MDKKVKLPNGETVVVTEVDFITRKEDFNEYQLQDGRILKLKSVLIGAYDVPGQKNSHGGRAVLVETNNVVTTDEFGE